MARSKKTVVGPGGLSSVPVRLTAAELSAYRELMMKDLRATYRDANRELISALKAADTDAQRFRAKSLTATVNRITRALRKDGLANGAQSVPVAYREGMMYTQAQTKALRIPIGAGMDTGTQIHTAAVDALSAAWAVDQVKATDAMNASAKTWIRSTQLSRALDTKISRAVGVGIVKGETRKATSSKIEQFLESKLFNGQTIKVGQRWFNAEDYAELVARTRTREAVTAGTMTTATGFGMDLYIWDVHDDPCPICRQYSGRVFSQSGTHPDFPALENVPPLHPRCECTIHPTTEGHIKRRMDYDSIVELSNDPKQPVVDQQSYEDALGAEAAKGARASGDKVTRAGARAEAKADADRATEKASSASQAVVRTAATTRYGEGKTRAIPAVAEQSKQEIKAASRAVSDAYKIPVAQADKIAKAKAKAVGVELAAARRAALNPKGIAGWTEDQLAAHLEINKHILSGLEMIRLRTKWAAAASVDTIPLGAEGAKAFGDRLSPVRLRKGKVPGGTYTDPSGQRWTASLGTTEGTERRARNEYITARIYQANRVKVPPARMVELNDRVGIARESADLAYTDTIAAGGAEALKAAQKARAVQRGYAVDALVGNRDSIGPGGANLLWMPGKTSSIQRTAGRKTLAFRGGWDTPGVQEIETLRDAARNADAAAVFGGLSDADVAAQIKAMSRTMTPKRIDAIVNDSGFTGSDAAEYKRTIKARMKWLIGWADDKGES